jgi:amino acid transporter
MQDEETTRLRIPLDWVIVDALGAILAGAGAYGLLAGPDGPLPLLSAPGVAWLCIAFGVGLMVLALTQILKRIMRQRVR